MKNARKLIPALAMLLVSAVLMSTASYAWFTMNTKVTASGMQITAVAPDALWIAQKPEGSGNPSWDISMTLANENAANSGTKLEPVTPKTENDYTAFQTVKTPSQVDANGDYDGEYVDSSSYYKDTFLLKLDGKVGTKRNVTVKAAVSFNGNGTTADGIWDALRVAVIANGGNVIYLNFTTLNDASTTDIAYVEGTGALVELTAAAETPTEVTVYAWIEGEDDACINANAFNEQSFNISLVFGLTDATSQQTTT